VMVAGDEAADLYQTYGVPPELFETMAAERNLTFDWDGFSQAMQQHGEASGKQQFKLFKTGPVERLKKAVHLTEFLGYETTEATAAIKGLIAQEKLCDHVKEVGHENPITIVLDRTPFYGESGGQVGDAGEITGDGFRFQVTDTQKDGDLILHLGHLVEGEMTAGGAVTAKVDITRRQGIRRAHSATHILHYALQKNLGQHAQQQGSKVDVDWLRFDFSNPQAVSPTELETIEADVSQQIDAGEPVGWETLPLAEARERGAMMLFGEKYPDPVRMVSMGQFSRELCGGTHLDNTAEVEQFEIVAEESVAAGTRRVVALTGAKAQEHREKTAAALTATAEKLECAAGDVPQQAASLLQEVRDLKKQISSGSKAKSEAPVIPAPPSDLSESAQQKHALLTAAKLLNTSALDVPTRVAALLKDAVSLRQQAAAGPDEDAISADALLEAAVEVDGVKVIVAEAPGASPNVMRQLIDQLRKKAAPVAILLASSPAEGKVVLVAGVSRDVQDRGASAGNWVKQVAPVVGGGGGGKPDMAQAGGRQPENLPAALEEALSAIRGQLGG